MVKNVFVTNELSPFTPGGIGRVLHNVLRCMDPSDRDTTLVIVTDQDLEPRDCATLFPGVEFACVNTRTELVKHINGSLAHDGVTDVALGRGDLNPPTAAYSEVPWLWQSVCVLRYLKCRSDSDEIHYIEFADWGAQAFATLQERLVNGFLVNCTIAIRLHTSHAVLCVVEGYTVSKYDLRLADLERKCLRDCDLLISQNIAATDRMREILAIDKVEWDSRIVLHTPPVLVDDDDENRTKGSIVPNSKTPIVFGSKLQRIKDPIKFVLGTSLFIRLHGDYIGSVIFAAHSFDSDYENEILGRIPAMIRHRFTWFRSDGTQSRNQLIGRSVFVVASPFESFCLAAYEASILGAIVVLNARNPAFGDRSPWVDGHNCIKYDGSPAGLEGALARAFAMIGSLALVSVGACVWPWVVALPSKANSVRRQSGEPDAIQDGAAVTACRGRLMDTEAANAPMNGQSQESDSTTTAARKNQASQSSASTSVPLVSVIIPYYNMGDYLLYTLECCLMQGYPSLEIIIVDDGSNDLRSAGLLGAIRNAKFENVTIVSMLVNGGLASARNAGFRHATGTYIMFLDSDDLIHRDFISTGVNCMQRNHFVDVVFTNARYFSDQSEIDDIDRTANTTYHIFIGEALCSGLRENMYSVSCCLLRREIVERYKYNEDLVCFEDWDFYMRLIRDRARCAVTNEAYFYYRNRSDSMVKSATNRRRRAFLLSDLLRVALGSQSNSPLDFLAIAEARSATLEAEERLNEIEHSKCFVDGHLIQRSKWLGSFIDDKTKGGLSYLSFLKQRRIAKLIRRFGLFDADWYLTENTDVRRANVDPFKHFIRHGMREGRAPNPSFIPQLYLNKYPDVINSGMSAIEHYILHGIGEGRAI